MLPFTRIAASGLRKGTFTGTQQLLDGRALGALSQVRLLNVHEYAGMEIMKKYGVTVPKGGVATSPREAEQIYRTVIGEGNDCVVKAQVLAGGRGLGHFKGGLKGGVHLCTSFNEVSDYTSHMLGDYLITKQTGADGILCSKVLLVERMYMRREMYISILLDRASGGPVIIASPAGGTSIEDVAATTPNLIYKHTVDIMQGLQETDARQIAVDLGFKDGSEQQRQTAQLLLNLYEMFRATDATLVEVNPLAETPDGKVVVCDAKLNFDDNAEFRQQSIFNLRDVTQEDGREVEASKWGLNYIGLNGNIGCMVNGAGLAMATMDIIKLKGGEPANFLDVGGGASETQVQKAFELLNHDKSVKAILVNIFGGIMRCDVIAMGIINAAREIGMKKPIVIRLQGTNVAEAKKLIEASGYRMVITENLEDAAAKAVSIADIVRQAEDVALNVQFESGTTFLPL